MNVVVADKHSNSRLDILLSIHSSNVDTIVSRYIAAIYNTIIHTEQKLSDTTSA